MAGTAHARGRVRRGHRQLRGGPAHPAALPVAGRDLPGRSRQLPLWRQNPCRTGARGGRSHCPPGGLGRARRGAGFQRAFRHGAARVASLQPRARARRLSASAAGAGALAQRRSGAAGRGLAGQQSANCSLRAARSGGPRRARCQCLGSGGLGGKRRVPERRGRHANPGSCLHAGAAAAAPWRGCVHAFLHPSALAARFFRAGRAASAVSGPGAIRRGAPGRTAAARPPGRWPPGPPCLHGDRIARLRA